MSIIIKLEKTLDHEFVSDILIVAFDSDLGACWEYGWFAPHYRPTETASATWLEVDKRPGDKEDDNYWIAVWVEQPEGYETGIAAADAVVQAGLRIDSETVRVGIQRILDGEADVHKESAAYAAILDAVATEDCSSIDADAADCIIQAGVYGKVVFS